MFKTHLRWLLVFLLAAPPAFAEGVEAISEAYAAGDFDGASQLINDLLLHENNLSPADRAQVFLMKARVELAYGRRGELSLWLGKAYQADHGLTLDPLLDPPVLQHALDEVRENAPPQPAAPKEKTAPAPEPVPVPNTAAADADLPPPPNVERALSTEEVSTGPSGVSTMLGLLPFGLPQARNGDDAKALVLAISHGIALTATVRSTDPAQAQMARGVFAASWLYSLYDGFKNRPSTSATLIGGHGFGIDIVPLATGPALQVTFTSQNRSRP